MTLWALPQGEGWPQGSPEAEQAGGLEVTRLPRPGDAQSPPRLESQGACLARAQWVPSVAGAAGVCTRDELGEVRFPALR